METETEVTFTCKEGTTEMCRRVGDLTKERQMEQRMKELGLWREKQLHESLIRSKLDLKISDADDLTKAFNSIVQNRRRRSRHQRRYRTKSFPDLVKTIFKRDFVRDEKGKITSYSIDVFLGRFTRDVSFIVLDSVVTVNCSANCDGMRLKKEINIEFESNDVRVQDIEILFLAGIVRILAPMTSSAK